MYNEHFGFDESPFNVTPDPRFFYSNRLYQEAFTGLRWGIKLRQGLIVISGEAARRQANRLKVPLAIELDLLVTHGVLHLVGYDDRDPVEAGLMHEREREILSAGRRRLPPRLWQGLLKTRPPASGSGHPRSTPTRNE